MWCRFGRCWVASRLLRTWRKPLRGREIPAVTAGTWTSTKSWKAATVYLPVSVPGALLYVGDGHAAQGDGELNGDALETSMDVEFTIDVIPGKRIQGPRVESATHIMAMGLRALWTMRSAARQQTWHNG